MLKKAPNILRPQSKEQKSRLKEIIAEHASKGFLQSVARTFRNTYFRLGFVATVAATQLHCGPKIAPIPEGALNFCNADKDCVPDRPQCTMNLCQKEDPPMCEPKEVRPCLPHGETKWSSEGECKVGKQECITNQYGDRIWGHCEGFTYPTKEICDSRDNDCDGEIDEDFSKKGSDCTVTNNGCDSTGTYVCNDKGELVCDAKATTTSPEVCDNKDNDCDGKVDEGLTRKVNTNTTGECKTGEETCEKGQWKVTKAPITPQKELCDNKDNDCDGKTDEDFAKKGESCEIGTAECTGKGTLQCDPNQTKLTCTAKPQPGKKELCDNKDNDCNGLIDDGLKRTSYSDAAATRNVGECKEKIEVCDKGSWKTTQQEITPKKELCDNKDNDCDGKKDEDFVKKGLLCEVGQADCKTQGTEICAPDGSKTICDATPKQGSKERCDNKDNDCDGKVDEDFTKKGKACQITVNNCVSTGKEVCSTDGTKTECDAPKNPTGSKEVCDNKDNDCDGKVDEDFTTKGDPCTSGSGSCTTTGKMECKPDTTGVECSAKSGSGTKEICDNKDNDCDGKIDEGLTRKVGNNSTGACAPGEQTCKSGQWITTKPEIKPTKEVCNNRDDNCNGIIDDKIAPRQSTYTGPTGTKNKGICTPAIEHCSSGTWVQTKNQVTPQKEDCNSKDNNCDGKVDCRIDTEFKGKTLKAHIHKFGPNSVTPVNEVIHYSDKMSYAIDGSIGGVRVTSDQSGDQITYRLYITDAKAKTMEFPKGTKIDTAGTKQVKVGLTEAKCLSTPGKLPGNTNQLGSCTFNFKMLTPCSHKVLKTKGMTIVEVICKVIATPSSGTVNSLEIDMK